MSTENTRERILDAAEDLFARRGISGSSLRAVTGRAGVNLAAVHYHFGSKQALLDAVVERRARPINASRMRALARIGEDGRNGTPTVEAILRAFFLPGLHSLQELPTKKDTLMRLLSRIEAQPPEVVEDLFRRHFGEVCSHYIAALERALPHLPSAQVADRFRFAIAIVTRVLSGYLDLDTIPLHPPSAVGDEEHFEHAVAFSVAGLEAPPRSGATAIPVPGECGDTPADDTHEWAANDGRRTLL